MVLYTGASYNEKDDTLGNLNKETLKKAVLENFNLIVDRPEHEPLALLLSEIGTNTNFDLEFRVHTEDDEEGDGDAAPDEPSKIATITITNGWKYNINGESMGYKVVQNIPDDSDEKGQILAPEIDTGDAPVGVGEDHLKITYDNTGTNYASETDATYQGGKLYLTLAGEALYKAKKVWQDQAVDASTRPKATVELWRYRNGEDLESAAPCGTKITRS